MHPAEHSQIEQLHRPDFVRVRLSIPWLNRLTSTSSKPVNPLFALPCWRIVSKQPRTASLITVLALALCPIVINAEVVIKGEYRDAPVLKKSESVATLDLPFDDQTNHVIAFGELTTSEKLEISNLSANHPNDIGIHRKPSEQASSNLMPKLSWRLTEHGWAGTATVLSPGAKSIRLQLQVQSISPIDLLFFEFDQNNNVTVLDSVIANSELTVHAEPAGQDVSDFEQFWSPSATGNTIGVQVLVPDVQARDTTSLTIMKVAHRFAHEFQSNIYEKAFVDLSAIQPNDLSACRFIDVNCYSGSVSQNASAATVFLRFEKSRRTRTCTATLINDTAPGTQHFLVTAAHCISRTSEASSVEARWFHQNRSCRSPVLDNRYTRTRGGAKFVVANAAHDISLINLKNPPPSAAYYAGLSLSSTAVSNGSSVHGVHHGANSRKQYYRGTVLGIWDQKTCLGSICSVNKKALIARNKIGIHQSGASGSGLFSGDNLIAVVSAAHDRCNGLSVSNQISKFYSEIEPHINPPPAVTTPSVVTFASASSSFSESDGQVGVKINISPSNSSAMDVAYKTGGTAADTDFQTLTNKGSVSVSANASSVNISISITDDTLHEGNETIVLSLVAGSDYNLGSVTSHTVTIKDDDSSPSKINLSVTPTTVSEGTRSATMSITASIDGTTQWPSSQSIRISITGSGATEVVGFSAVPSFDLDIASGASSGTSQFTLIPVDDAVETIDETITVSGTHGSTSVKSVSFSLTDDDKPPDAPLISISASGFVREGELASFTLTAKPLPAASLAINLEVSHAVNSNFLSTTSLGQQSIDISTSGTATYELATLDDTVDESNGGVIVTVRSGTGYAVGTPSSASVDVIDNDATTVELARSNSDAIREDGGVAYLTATLSRRLMNTETVTAPLSVSGNHISASDYSLNLATGTGLNSGVTLMTSTPHSASQPAARFSGDDLNTVQMATFALTAVDNGDSESDTETLAISFGQGNRGVTSNLDLATGSGADGTKLSGSVNIEINNKAENSDPPPTPPPPPPPEEDPEPPSVEPPPHIPEDDHGDSQDLATTVSSNSLTEGRFEVAGDRDYFKFSLSNHGVVSIDTIGEIDTHCSLMNNEEEIAEDDDGGDDRNCAIQETVEVDDYWVLVRGYGRTTGYYSLQIKSWSSDISNNLNQPYELAVNSSFDSRLGEKDDVDYFSVSLDQPGTMGIYTRGDADTIGCLLIDRTGLLKESWICDDDSGVERNFLIQYEVSHPTSYLFSVEGYNDSTGDYELSVILNETVDTSDLMSNSVRIASTASNWSYQLPSTLKMGNIDSYRVDIHEASRLVVKLTGEYGIRSRVFRAPHLQIPVLDISKRDPRLETHVSSGTYYLSIEGDTEAAVGSYLLNIDLDQTSATN